MNAPLLRRGECPTLAAPMQTGDGLLARLNPVDGGLTPAQLIGLAVSFVGMIAGSYLPQRTGRPSPAPDPHAELHHHAAAQTHHTGAD